MGKMMRLSSRFIGFLLILMLLFFLWAGLVEPQMLIIRKSSIELPVSQEVRVVFFTDTHLGKWYAPENLQKICDKINDQQPDIVIFGGDFFDVYRRDTDILDLSQISEILKQIKAPLGKYAVWGNHDYGEGAEEIYPIVMQEGGFSLLKNSGILLQEQNLYLYGIDDLLFGRPQTDEMLLTQDTAKVLISHEPDTVDLLNEFQEGLMLSGHSHGGQIRLPVITQKILPPGARKYVKGYYQTEQGKLFVSSGIGMTKLPLRFGTPPEICVIDLNPKK